MVRLSEIPHSRVAVLLVLGFFALAGVLVVDDFYYVSHDESDQRHLANGEGTEWP